jgi:molybdenum cofactor cytidylyltransferase
MSLPWGHTTVIGKVIMTLLEAGLSDLLVVTGSNQDELEGVLTGFPIKFINNPLSVDGEMILSVQAGLRGIQEKTEAALIVLGDQPQIETQVIRLIIDEYYLTRSELIIPSFQLHRGHPWLIACSIWDDYLKLKYPQTSRDFLNQHVDKINYINVNNPSIIQDLDTPDDYIRFTQKI